MDHKHSAMHHSAWRMGAVVRDHVKVFQIETTLDNDVFPKPYDFLQKREWEWSVKDQASMLGVRRGLALAPDRLKHKLFHDMRSAYGLTGVAAGEVEAVLDLGTGRPVMLRSFATGDIFGDRALLEHQPWPATYRVTAPARLFRLDAAGLAEALQGNPDPRQFLDALRSRRHDHDVAAAVRKLVASPA